LLTGDPANADPVCDLSPHHHLVTAAVAAAAGPVSSEDRKSAQKALVFRDHRISIPIVVAGGESN
jgi:PqqA peptide cyclase